MRSRLSPKGRLPKLWCNIKARGSGGEKESLLGHMWPPLILCFYYIKFSTYVIFILLYNSNFEYKFIGMSNDTKINKDYINNLCQTALVPWRNQQQKNVLHLHSYSFLLLIIYINNRQKKALLHTDKFLISKFIVGIAYNFSQYLKDFIYNYI